MTKANFLATAAAAFALAATPVFAQDPVQPRSGTHAKPYKVRHHTRHRMWHHARAYRPDERFAQRNDFDNGWNRRSGFWPVDTAGAIAGGAINTAGAIATGAVGTAGAIASAPFRGSYDNGYYGGYGRPYGVAYNPHSGVYGNVNGYPYGNRYRYGNTFASMDEDVSGYKYNGIAIPTSPNYDARNGFTCRPGTVTKLANGQHAICQ